MGVERTLTFVGGGSAKFWEVRQDGAELHIRFGRLGAAGQTQVKSFGSAADATAAADKLVADKLRKGYTEDETASSPQAASPTGSIADEDRLTLPSAWLRELHPRRGGAKVSVKRPDASAPEKLAAELDKRRMVLAETVAKSPDPELASEGAAYLASDPAGTPLGAAVVAKAMAESLSWHEREMLSLFAETWLAERGPAFAAVAVTELASLDYVHDGNSWLIRRMADDETPERWHAGAPTQQIDDRVRAALAAASDDEYAEAVAALAVSRKGGIHHRVAASFLAPTETGWVTADCAEVSQKLPTLGYRLIAAISAPEHAELIKDHVPGYSMGGSLSLPATVVDGMGEAAVPLLAAWVDQAYNADYRKRLLDVLADLPYDTAMRALLDRIEQKYTQPAFLRAASRFPRRAMRMLAESGGKAVHLLLRAHVAAHPELVDEVLASLGDGAAAERVRAIVTTQAVAAAPPDALPEVLVSPPWTRPRKARKAVVVNGLACTDEPALVWAPGEQDNWRSPRPGEDSWDRPWRRSWEEIAREITESPDDHFSDEIALFVAGPEELSAPLIPKWRPGDLWGAGEWMPKVVARFELAALPMVLDSARRAPSSVAMSLLPFAAPEVAVLMADWLARLKSVRATALAWLNRHPGTAARALIPAALGKPGAARLRAEQALAALVTGGHRDTVAEAAARYGADAEAAIADLLVADPLDALPAKMPVLPEWTEVAIMAPIPLRGGAGELPPEAVRHVLTMLAISKLGEPYAGLAVVKEACDGRGLADFAWALFQCWQAAGYPSKERWVMDAQALLGDDETVRRLTPLIRAWPGEGGHTRAVAGLDLLASIGSEVALMHLHGIAEKVKFNGLKNQAKLKMDEVAAELGLTPQELADRLVPDFGLSADGNLTLDYGRRQFVVGFDEQLKPYVADASGKRLKNLPKPGVNDDQELAPAAYRRFAGLKKDVRSVAGDTIHRLEQAMVDRRRWSAGDFERLLVGHPLLWHIVRRLVWGLYDPAGELTGTLRVAEDRSFADVEDDTLMLPDDALVGVVHPLELGEELAAWSEVFADYEILQPFPQLGRETYELDPALVAEIEAAKIPTRAVIGLERRGWRRGAPQDAGWQCWIERDVPGGRTITIHLDPGIVVGYLDFEDEQTLVELGLDGLDPITTSEILRELRDITR
ncbi:WGR domain-containing protein, predicted DNA-binding domain in MolR [Nonomuraea maritima]|uniref:WGR domain-containing protein, predicted DNA-binding domain in MolR n=1 Tax=Nonomuraea maritima TaxID=683260 RepID=A0A1G9EYG8_9ACTN|nr:DUF4132 domain-containing protein [Nonomuraea maritima]SDK81161.1 WGR domain-containing protein, predicted DNA-binding domain in MolR [Nonomuraea maritima]